MKTMMVVLAILSALLLFSTVMCGLWIRYSGEVVEDSSITFHLGIGLATAVVSVVTLALAVFRG
jgi:hypothetical protein